MKRALISDGSITDVVAVADEFEVHTSELIFWVDCDDAVSTSGGWSFDMVNKTFIFKDKPDDTYESRIIARTVAYGSFGEQMTMQYNDAVNGTTTWVDHVDTVKSTTLRPSDLLI